MKDPWVKREIRRELAERKKNLKFDAARLDEEIAKLAFSNLFDYVQPDGQIDLEKVNRDQAAAILELKWGMAGQELDDSSAKVEKQEVDPAKQLSRDDLEVEQKQQSVAEGERLEPQPQGGALRRAAKKAAGKPVLVKLKLHSKTKALEMAGRRLKAFTDKVEHEGRVTVVVDL